jgi:hypothetical protein
MTARWKQHNATENGTDNAVVYATLALGRHRLSRARKRKEEVAKGGSHSLLPDPTSARLHTYYTGPAGW